MKKSYVYKVNATGEVFHDLNSAVNAAALDLYRRHRFGTARMSNPVAVKRLGGYAVHAFDLYGACYTANIDVFVPSTLTKKGKQIKVDGLNATAANKFHQFASCEWGEPAPAPDPIPVDLEVYDVDEDDDYDEDDDCTVCEHCGVIIEDDEQAYETEDGEIVCEDCYDEYLADLDAEDLDEDDEDDEDEE